MSNNRSKVTKLCHVSQCKSINFNHKQEFLNIIFNNESIDSCGKHVIVAKIFWNSVAISLWGWGWLVVTWYWCFYRQQHVSVIIQSVWQCTEVITTIDSRCAWNYLKVKKTKDIVLYRLSLWVTNSFVHSHHKGNSIQVCANQILTSKNPYATITRH